jgi:predicted ATPase
VNRRHAAYCDACGFRLGAPDGSTLGPRWTGDRPFVGRRREMGGLNDAMERALGGQGTIAVLAGEPGIGKSRSTRELATVAESRGFQVFWGRCREGQGAPSFWPWVQMVRAYAQTRDAETLRAEMGLGAADIVEIAPDLREKLPGLPPTPSLEPEQARFVCSILSRPSSRTRPASNH